MPGVVQLEIVQRAPGDDGWQRRLALQLAAQLPEKPADALAVLALTEELVKAFLMPGGA